jgi:hypothetical protein
MGLAILALISVAGLAGPLLGLSRRWNIGVTASGALNAP